MSTVVVIGVLTSIAAQDVSAAPAKAARFHATVASTTCPVLQSATYIGSMGYVSGPGVGAYFSDVLDVTVTGPNTATIVATNIQGRTVIQNGSTYQATVDCNLESVTGPGIQYFQGTINPDGSVSGTFLDVYGDTDWFAAAPETNVVTDPAGGSASTGSTVSSDDPIQASASSVNPGTLQLGTAVNNNGATDGGFSLLGPLVKIDTPTADYNNPLTLTMTVDPSVLNGQDPATVTVFENGAPAVQWCPSTPPIDATTDPCEVNPPYVDPVTGAVTFTVLSTHASVWTLGTGCSLSVSAFLPPGHVGQHYVGSFAGCGGTQPWTFSKSGKLPKGLKLSKTGTVQGIPTIAGTYSFTVKIKDSSKKKKKTVTKVVSITVS